MPNSSAPLANLIGFLGRRAVVAMLLDGLCLQRKFLATFARGGFRGLACRG